LPASKPTKLWAKVLLPHQKAAAEYRVNQGSKHATPSQSRKSFAGCRVGGYFFIDAALYLPSKTYCV